MLGVAFFATIHSIVVVDHFFVAFGCRARFVRGIVRFDQMNGTAQLEVIWLVAVAQILQLGIVERHPFGGKASASRACRYTCGDILTATVIKPAAQTMTFDTVWVDFHNAAAANRKCFAAIELIDTGIFDQQNRLIEMVEIFGFFSPQGQRDGRIAVVDQRNITFDQLTTRCLCREFNYIANFTANANHICNKNINNLIIFFGNLFTGVIENLPSDAFGSISAINEIGLKSYLTAGMSSASVHSCTTVSLEKVIS